MAPMGGGPVTFMREPRGPVSIYLGLQSISHQHTATPASTGLGIAPSWTVFHPIARPHQGEVTGHTKAGDLDTP